MRSPQAQMMPHKISCFFFPHPQGAACGGHTHARLHVGWGINPAVEHIPKGGQKTEGYKTERLRVTSLSLAR